MTGYRAPTSADFDRWAAEGWLPAEQAERLRVALHTGPRADAEGPKGLNLLTVAYYFGALLIIGALAWFLYDQWDGLGPRGILGVASLYAFVFAGIGYVLRFKRGFPVAGGILFACAVWMVPLMTWAAQKVLGLWPLQDPGTYHAYYVWINGSWIVIEWATILAGLGVLRWVRFPFVTFPIAFALWFFSMDVAGIVLRDASPSGEVWSWCSVIVGVFMLAAAYAADRQFPEDLSFWVYLYGLLTFWGGLTTLPSHGEPGRLVYFAINLLLAFSGVYLMRSTFLVFATMGVLAYLGHLAASVFRNSSFFPVIVAAIGIAVILGAVALQRQRGRLDAALDRYRPRRLRLSGAGGLA
jgi:Predicted membrane protein (DUF2157)